MSNYGSSEICLDSGQNQMFGQGNLLSKVHYSRRLESGWWAKNDLGFGISDLGFIIRN